MARLSKQQKLARYRGRIDASRKWREQEGYDKTWLRLKDLYRGKHFEGTSDEDRIAVNMAFSTLNVIFPSITVNHPKLSVSARKLEDEDRATIAEAVLNYWWRHFNLQKPVRAATKDYLTFGHGWLKTSYRFDEREVPMSDDEVEEEFAARKAEADAFADENPELAGDLPSDEDIRANLVDVKTIVNEDRPVVERVSPSDIFVDPEATCESDMQWIAQRSVRPLEEVREDKRYKSSARNRVQADAQMKSEWLTKDTRKYLRDDVDRVTVWEYYDLKAGTMCVFAEMSDEFLIDPIKMPYEFGHPYDMMRNYDVSDEFYPIGDLEMIADPQLELDKTRSMMMNHRKRYSRKYLYRESAFGKEGRAALESQVDNIGVPVTDDSPLGDIVAPFPTTPMSADLYNYSDIIESDIDKITGVNEYARGAMPEIRRTATEASIIQDAANARASDKLAAVEATIASVARKVLILAQQYMTGEQAAYVVGGDGQQVWFGFDHHDIQGEFDFEVEAGSTQPNNETFKRQQAMQFMEVMGPFIQMGLVAPQEVLRFVLTNGFGVKNVAKFMAPPAPPMDPMAAGMPPGAQPPPGAMPPGAMPPGAVEMPPPAPTDISQMGVPLDPSSPTGGLDSIPPEIIAQLLGQMGYAPTTM